MEKLDLEIFTGLLKNLKCETGNEKDVIGFRAKYKGYEISFHGELDDNYDVIVGDFGRMLNGKWEQAEPKQYQLQLMKIKLQSKNTNITIQEIKILQQESDAIDREIEIDKYGPEGAIYSNHY